jgi:hypothetical protein
VQLKLEPKPERNFGKGGDVGNLMFPVYKKIIFLAQEKFFLLTGAS